MGTDTTSRRRPELAVEGTVSTRFGRATTTASTQVPQQHNNNSQRSASSSKCLSEAVATVFQGTAALERRYWRACGRTASGGVIGPRAHDPTLKIEWAQRFGREDPISSHLARLASLLGCLDAPDSPKLHSAARACSQCWSCRSPAGQPQLRDAGRHVVAAFEPPLLLHLVSPSTATGQILLHCSLDCHRSSAR